ncbi:MAG: ATPase domain-containing protein [Candidatus Micrarchaeota archaeon]
MVDKAFQDKVKTGVPGFDSMIEGGFERKSVIVLAGEAGSGKTTFAMQYLYSGAALYKEPGLYITFEEQKSTLFKHMARMGWDFEKLVKEKKIFVLEYPPHEVESFINEGNVVEDLIRENGIQRVVIDSVTSLVLLRDEEYKRRQALLKTIDSLRKWGATTILLSEAVMESGRMNVRFGIEYLADGLILIYNIRKGDVRDLALEISKMRGTAHERKLCLMKITSKGIVLYPNQSVLSGPNAHL